MQICFDVHLCFLFLGMGSSGPGRAGMGMVVDDAVVGSDSDEYTHSPGVDEDAAGGSDSDSAEDAHIPVAGSESVVLVLRSFGPVGVPWS